MLIILDKAGYHRYAEMRKYSEEINKGPILRKTGRKFGGQVALVPVIKNLSSSGIINAIRSEK